MLCHRLGAGNHFKKVTTEHVHTGITRAHILIRYESSKREGGGFAVAQPVGGGYKICVSACVMLCSVWFLGVLRDVSLRDLTQYSWGQLSCNLSMEALKRIISTEKAKQLASKQSRAKISHPPPSA